MSKFQWNAGWWFQPTWKILVKLEIFPKYRGENKKNETTTKNELVYWDVDGS